MTPATGGRVLRAAVVGAGRMGRHHVRLLNGFDDVELVAVVDADADLAASHARSAGCEAFTSPADIPDVDIAVVATPTPSHREVAGALIERGVHVLIEKPMAPAPEDAAYLVELAEARGVTMAVGHVERFNPAVSTMRQIVTEPLSISFERLSPFTPRIPDSVVFDLMVHDLDLACWLVGERPVRIEALGGRVMSDSLDVCSAVLGFGNGCVVTLQASRVTQDKVRSIAVSERERYIVADCVRQDLVVKRETEADFGTQDGALGYRQASVLEVPYLDRGGEPIARELRDFIDAVREGRPPLVSGHDGLSAVQLAHQVEQAALRGPDA